MPWWKPKPKHYHRGSVLRVEHWRVTKTEDNFAAPIGPYTLLMCKCDECGEAFTVEKRGTWKVEDFV